MKFDLKKDSARLALTCLGACLMAFNICTFVSAGGLYPGGAAGLTLLIQRSAQLLLGWHIPYTLINLVINSIPIYIGFRFIGKKFTLFSCIAIMLTNILNDMLPHYIITYDTLLISVFGGILNGVGISLCLAGGATSGGTDFISIYLSEKNGTDSWNLILGFNICILAIAGLLFGWEKALYSIIFQFSSTQILHALYKRYQQKTLLIVTDHPDDVYQLISQMSHHGATIWKAEGSYSGISHSIVYSVVSSSESKAIINIIRTIDPKAFINVMRTDKLLGNFHFKPTE